MATHPDPIDVAVGARIRARRNYLGISQTKLAQGLGLTFQQVQKYERGDNRVSASTLVRVAATLQSSVAALVGEQGEPASGAATYQHLAEPGAFDLLSAYASISDHDVRKAILRLARSVSKSPGRAAAA